MEAGKSDSQRGKERHLPGKPMISIVDDDASVRQATQGLVRSLGYGAAVFASAEEFLDSDHVAATACLITDVEMPGLSGIELQSRLLADGHRFPIIFITAYPEERVRAKAEEAGAFGFFSKPFEEDCFIGCLARAINARSDTT
jgi:FixJ family two-component response regulator